MNFSVLFFILFFPLITKEKESIRFDEMNGKIKQKNTFAAFTVFEFTNQTIIQQNNTEVDTNNGTLDHWRVSNKQTNDHQSEQSRIKRGAHLSNHAITKKKKKSEIEKHHCHFENYL